MESPFLDMLLALATAMGGWKSLHFIAEKWSARNGGAKNESVEDRMTLHLQKEEEKLDRIHEDFERLHESMERILAAQQITNQILSEVKGRLAQRGD